MNVHKCMNINLYMIIIISCGKQVTMFFSKHFMDSYGVEHLPKMRYHTMHSPKKLKINNSNEKASDMKILQLDEILAWLKTTNRFLVFLVPQMQTSLALLLNHLFHQLPCWPHWKTNYKMRNVVASSQKRCNHDFSFLSDF
jgi:hypothetical protein